MPLQTEPQNKNPAESAFWQERWSNGTTPWDRGGVQQAFVDYVSQQKHPVSTLIPGCGSAHEAAYLSQRGWQVAAIDYAASAVEVAQKQMQSLGISPDIVQLADFFEYIPQAVPQWIFERTFLCALPVSLRLAYAQKVAGLLPSGGVLAGLFFIDDTLTIPADQVKGPPFPMTQTSLDALLRPNFVREVDLPSNDGLPLFAGKERWQVWRRR